MSTSVDLAVYNRKGQLSVVAEVKNIHGTSTDWATQMRRNLLAHAGPYDADYFLLITPDRIYLWKNAATTPTLIPPDCEIDAVPVFASYFDRSRVDPNSVSSQAFELIASAWLSDLVSNRLPSQLHGEKGLPGPDSSTRSEMVDPPIKFQRERLRRNQLHTRTRPASRATRQLRRTCSTWRRRAHWTGHFRVLPRRTLRNVQPPT